MVRLALCSALSDRLNEGKLRLLDSWPFEVPKTKDAVKVLNALELEGRVLVVLSSDDAVAERSFGNLPNVHLVEAAQLSAYEVLANDWIVFTTATVPGGVTVVEGSAPKPKRKPRAKAGAGTAAASGGETSAGDDSRADEDATESADESLGQAQESEAVDDSADESKVDESPAESVAEAEVSPPAASSSDSDAEPEDDSDDEEDDDE
jgi:hypothetical protein